MNTKLNFVFVFVDLLQEREVTNLKFDSLRNRAILSESEVIKLQVCKTALASFKNKVQHVFKLLSVFVSF